MQLENTCFSDNPEGDVTDIPYATKKRLHENQAAPKQAAFLDASIFSASSIPPSPGYVHLDFDNGSVPLASPPHESDPTLQPEPAQVEEPKLCRRLVRADCQLCH